MHNGKPFSCKNDKTMQLAAIYMELKGLLLSEIRIRKTNTGRFDL